MSNEELSIIYRGNIVQADLLKCLLEGEGIDCVLQDEFVGMIAPYVSSPGGVQAVTVLVATNDLDRARPIVEGFIRDSAG